MTRYRLTIGVCVWCASLVAPTFAQNADPSTLTFKTWRSLSQDARREVFPLLSPQKRAQIVTSHVETWRDEHHSRLSGPQLDLIDEAIRFVTPDKYATGSETRQSFRGFEKDFLARAQSAFVAEDIAELFYLQFEPKTQKK